MMYQGVVGDYCGTIVDKEENGEYMYLIRISLSDNKIKDIEILDKWPNLTYSR